MEINSQNLIQELIRFENKVAELYDLFGQFFEEDNEFWEKLKNEEENHAIILDNAQKQFLKMDKFPQELIEIPLSRVVKENIRLNSILNDFKITIPTKKIAFETALEIEKYFSEYIYQQAMVKPNPGKILSIIQKINNDEKNHIERIEVYMNSKK